MLRVTSLLVLGVVHSIHWVDGWEEGTMPGWELNLGLLQAEHVFSALNSLSGPSRSHSFPLASLILHLIVLIYQSCLYAYESRGNSKCEQKEVLHPLPFQCKGKIRVEKHMVASQKLRS